MSVLSLPLDAGAEVDTAAALDVVSASDDAVATRAVTAGERPFLRSRLTATRWRRLVKTMVGVADILAVGLAALVALRLRSELPGRDRFSTGAADMVVTAASLPLWVMAFARQRLYIARHVASRAEEWRGILRAAATAVIGMSVLAYVIRVEPGRGFLLLTFLGAVPLVGLEREFARRVFGQLRREGKLLRPVVIVGRNAEGLAISELLSTDPSLGYEVVGFADDSTEERAHLFDRPVLGPVRDIADIVARSGAAGVIVATTAVDVETSNLLARELTDAGVHVELSSSLRDIATRRLSMHTLGRFPVVYVQPVPRVGWRPVAKRTFDVIASAFALVVTLPMTLVIAAAVKATSSGPVLYRQERIGMNGQPFKVLKFRTMVVDAEARLAELLERNEADGPLFKMRNDPRVTSVGRVLRKLSIDELPQFWNVLKGDMSLVGPRPALATEAAQWPAHLEQRLRVKPGITGMWQVSGRTDANFEAYSRLDLYYVDNWSLASDLAIIARTVPCVLFRQGAY